mgnify:CR=1 FL=1
MMLRKFWKSHYQGILNEEFGWNKDSLPEIDPVQGPAIRIEKEMAIKAVNKMNNSKTPGPTGLVVEMFKAGEDACTDLVNSIIDGGKVP